jgi:hypothetical protein
MVPSGKQAYLLSLTSIVVIEFNYSMMREILDIFHQFDHDVEQVNVGSGHSLPILVLIVNAASAYGFYAFRMANPICQFKPYELLPLLIQSVI